MITGQPCEGPAWTGAHPKLLPLAPPTGLGGCTEIFPPRMLVHGGGSAVEFPIVMLLRDVRHSHWLCMSDT